ncbi:MAG: hypothetical protein ACOYKZ_06230 [Chlamydiia bacterium]
MRMGFETTLRELDDVFHACCGWKQHDALRAAGPAGWRAPRQWW